MLSKQQVSDIAESKGFEVLNLADYKSLDTVMRLKCKNGHLLDASIKTVRNANFVCPICDGNNSISNKLTDSERPPQKSGKRIVAIDNATENVGVAVFDDNKLVFYHLYHIQGDTITRLLKNRKLLEDEIITT